MSSIQQNLITRKLTTQGNLLIEETEVQALPQMMWIAVKDLFIDQDYQRTQFSQGRVDKIVENFEWTLFGAITVMKRGDKFFVPDGQHRVRAARALGLPKIPCMVTISGGVASEAIALVKIATNRSGVLSVDRFKAMVTAGDPIYVAVKKMLCYMNLNITKSANGAGNVAFPTLIVSTFKANPRFCEKALFMQCKIVGDAPEPLSQEIHKGLFYLLRNLAPGHLEIMESAVARVFSHGGRTAILHAIRARSLSSTGLNRHEMVCAMGCLDVLNKGLKKHIRLNSEAE